MSSFKIYKKSIKPLSSKQLFDQLLKVSNFYKPNIFKNSNYYPKSWTDQKFLKKMFLLRKDKKIFSVIYDTMQLSKTLTQLPYDDKLHKIAANYLKINEKNLMLRSVQLRMDFPFDFRNSYGWHQDNAYDKFNLQSKNSAILWIPLVDTDVKNGTIVIKPGSENSTFNYSRKVKIGNKYESEQILVKNKYLKKYDSQSINMIKNNCLATYGGLFHRSGENKSDHIRFTIVVRYNNILSKDFLFYRELNKLLKK